MSEIMIRIITICISMLSGFGLGIIGHLLTKKRDFNNKKREIRINYLIEAYRKIERGAIPNSILFNNGDFESAIADIQLIGNSDQVRMAFEFAEAAAHGNGDKHQDLLENIRKELREELKIYSNDLPRIRPFRIRI